MAEEKNNPEEVVEFGAQDYIENLNALKETMISREEYNKILADNKKLVNALANGGGYMKGAEEKKPVDINEIRRKLFSPETQKKSNLQYFTEVMALRDGLIEAGQPDPFLPFNRDYVPSQQDQLDCERVAAAIKDCIEYAEGDPGVFNVALQKKCGIKKINK